jgi:N-acetylneuraminic acid mutarotase
MEVLTIDDHSFDELSTTTTTKWKSLAAEVMEESRGGCAAVLYEKRIYVFGGSNEREVLPTVEIFDLSKQRWIREQTLIEDMPSSRAYHAAVRIRDKVYLVGGEDEDGKLCSAMDVLNLETQTWETLNRCPMLYPSKFCGATNIGDKFICVAGGRNNDGRVYSNVQLFDVNTETWTELPKMKFSRSACTLSVLAGGSLLVAIGGKGDDHENRLGAAADIVETLQIKKTSTM